MLWFVFCLLFDVLLVLFAVSCLRRVVCCSLLVVGCWSSFGCVLCACSLFVACCLLGFLFVLGCSFWVVSSLLVVVYCVLFVGVRRLLALLFVVGDALFVVICYSCLL